jgi:hypothetical protein
MFISARVCVFVLASVVTGLARKGTPTLASHEARHSFLFKTLAVSVNEGVVKHDEEELVKNSWVVFGAYERSNDGERKLD